ncbi:MAG TPA: hypothetical protein VKT32_11330 [Chthonomonadaceae bacterium]|nr:hypothetical protein [Chthonomonadaceae bacterium]
MSKDLTLHLADEEYEAIERAATAAGRAPEEWATAHLVQSLTVPGDRPYPGLKALPELLKGVMLRMAERAGVDPDKYAADWWARYAPKPRPPMTEAEMEAARQRLMRFAGAVSSGDPHSSDNDRIDADLMRAYADNHAEDV